MANSITTNQFNANLIDFFTGKTDGVYRAGSDGSYRLTLPELIGISGRGGFGGTYGTGYSFEKVMKDNFKANGMKMLTSIIFIPMIANVATKALRKPVLNPMNKMLKMTGLDVKV